MQNLIEEYIDFQKGSEPPIIFHRWSIISALAAFLGRRTFITHGHSKIYPNMYVMLVGEAGSRKSTAIKRAQSLLVKGTGYKTISADKTSKEKLLVDLEEGLDKIDSVEHKMDVTKKNPTMKALFNLEVDDEPRECYIVADEFNSFLGHSNLEFIDLLTNIWDYDGVYKSRIKNGRSVTVPFPTFNILAGNTGVGISQAFPPEAIGQGFFSRIIMVFSEPSGRRVPFPPQLDVEQYNNLCNILGKIKKFVQGEMTFTNEAKKNLEEIYTKWKDLDDVRFKSYSTRRFTHLLKLCQVSAAAKIQNTITTEDIIYANSILYYTEHFMPQALGEFGKARNADVSAKILELLDKTDKPLSLEKDIWRQVRRDLDSAKQLADIMRSLVVGGKAQQVGNGGFMPIKQEVKFDYECCDVRLLKEYIEDQIKKGLVP